MTAVHMLIATIPARKPMAERLLNDVAKQSLIPNLIEIYLDRYDGQEAPKRAATLNVLEHRLADSTGGPGGRWRVLTKAALTADVVFIYFDDDQMLMTPSVIKTMVEQVTRQEKTAVAFRGVGTSGMGGAFSAGTPLASIAGGAFACRLNDLQGIAENRAEIQAKCGFDPWGPLGDDDAALSLHFWRRGITMRAAGPLAISEAPSARRGSQFEQRQEAKKRDGKPLFWQRAEIAKAFNWPVKPVFGG